MKNLTKDELLTIIVNSLNNLASVMSATFVNVCLYTYTSSIPAMCLYTALRISMFPFFFTLAGKIAQRKGFSLTLTFGLIGFIIQLASVLGLNPYFASYPWLIYIVAIILGIAEGFLWLSLNSLQQFVSKPQSRSRYLALNGIGNNLASIIAPIASSILISISPNDNEGYLLIFKIVLVLYAILVVLSFQIKTRCPNISFSILKCLKLPRRQPQWRYCMISTFLYGLRDSLGLMLTGLLIYDATGGSGSIYSQLLAWFSILAIISYLLCKHFMVRSNRMKFYTISAILMASATIVLSLCPNLFGAIYFGVVNAIAGSFYGNAYLIIAMNIISDYAASENVTGRVIAKETYLSIGRVTGMLFAYCLYLLFPKYYLIPSVIILSLFAVVLIIYANIYHSQRDRAKKALEG